MKNGLDRKTWLAIVSDNLRKLRESRFPDHGGKKHMADLLGVKIQQWSPWEKGQRSPSDTRLEKIACYFGVPVDFFWTDHRELSRESFARILPAASISSIDSDMVSSTSMPMSTAQLPPVVSNILAPIATTRGGNVPPLSTPKSAEDNGESTNVANTEFPAVIGLSVHPVAATTSSSHCEANYSITNAPSNTNIVGDIVKQHIKNALKVNNVKAILKFEFSITDVEFV